MNSPQQMSFDELAEQLALRASRKCADGYAVPFDSDLDQAAASALSSQSLSLSEARSRGDAFKAAIEVAIGLFPHVRDDATQHALCVLRNALASSVLENGPAVLADATSNPSSPHCGKGVAAGPAVSEGDRGHGAPVTSGAEVAVKPLEWREPTRANNGLWIAESIFGTFSVGFDDGWHACIDDGMRWEWEPESDPRSYEGPFAAQEACQRYLETRIRSALVSGSREEQ